MRFVILGRSIGLKKPKKKKKITRSKYRNRRPWYPRTTTLKSTLTYLDQQNAHYNVKNVPVFVPVCLYMLLICSFFRLKELFQVKNGLTTTLLFFLPNAKNLGLSVDAKPRKKEDGLTLTGT